MMIPAIGQTRIEDVMTTMIETAIDVVMTMETESGTVIGTEIVTGRGGKTNTIPTLDVSVITREIATTGIDVGGSIAPKAMVVEGEKTMVTKIATEKIDIGMTSVISIRRIDTTEILAERSLAEITRRRPVVEHRINLYTINFHQRTSLEG